MIEHKDSARRLLEKESISESDLEPLWTAIRDQIHGGAVARAAAKTA